MENSNTKTTWQSYLETELPLIKNILAKHQFSLDEHQPHIIGERFMMQAVTTIGGKKIILYGQDKNDTKVVIKATRDRIGKDELLHERVCRNSLHTLNFSYNIFHSPKEIAFISANDFIISIQEFIDQTSSFLERTLQEQFNFALAAFKAQEGARATTAGHIRRIKKIFNYRTSSDYLNLHAGFLEFIKQHGEIAGADTIDLIDQTQATLTKQKERIEQYGGFLTHTDFVPHNFRIKDDTLYLLDFSSLQFGNKHESWARFLNFMTLYNPTLESLLISYVENNRAVEERESLQLMRLFRLGEIITYYIKNVLQTNGALKTLNQIRVKFWSDVLKAEQKDQRVSRDIIKTYQDTRDALRSEDEKVRQIGLH